MEGPGRGGAEASSHRYLMFEAVVALLSAIAAPAGAVLILDDLHQADPSTLQLLEHLARHQSPARLLIVAIVVTPAPVTGILADPGAVRITLGGLSGNEVGKLLAAVTGRNGGTPSGWPERSASSRPVFRFSSSRWARNSRALIIATPESWRPA